MHTIRVKTFLLSLLIVLFFPLNSLANWHLQWIWELPPRKPAWEHTQRMDPDWEYMPVRAGDLVLVGCEFNGALFAFDVTSGAERWRFVTSGPIRAIPAVNGDRIALGSQDGHLYLLERATGKQIASRFLGPYPDQKDQVIGHDRVISAWPLDTPPLFHGDRLYASSGIWPLDGVQLWCLNPDTLETVWFQPDLPVRPHGLFSTSSNIVLRAHGGDRVFDPMTGAILPMKAPKPPPREMPEGIPGVEGQVMHRSIQGDRAFVTTKEGTIACFGPELRDGIRHRLPPADTTRKWEAGPDILPVPGTEAAAKNPHRRLASGVSRRRQYPRLT